MKMFLKYEDLSVTFCSVMKKVKVMTNTLFMAALFNLVICKKYLVELEESDELNVRIKNTKQSNLTGGEDFGRVVSRNQS